MTRVKRTGTIHAEYIHTFLMTFVFVSCTEGTKNTLKEHLIDELDYNLVPEDAWKKLVSWYNIVDLEVSDMEETCVMV